MKTIICDKCKHITNHIHALEYNKYKIEFGRETIFGTKGTVDLCENYYKEFLQFIS